MGVKHVFSSINAHLPVLSLGTVICAISDTSLNFGENGGFQYPYSTAMSMTSSLY